jgi:Ca2+-binding EF-hand superfamily protein
MVLTLKLIVILTTSLCSLNSVVKSQATHSSFEGGQEADDHLHQNQIPPPGRQPSEPEIKDALAELIETVIDLDKDGQLNSDELKDWLEKNHHKILDDNIDRQWNYYAPSVQEIHSWEGYAPQNLEVLHWNDIEKANFPTEYMDPTNEHYASMLVMKKRSENRWKLADKNTDTVLTKSEFKDYTYPEESERIREVLVDEAIEDMDTNKDDVVSLDEFVAHLTDVTDEAEKSDPEWLGTQQNHFTVYLDKDKDGTLSREELRAWLIPPFNKHEAEAWRLITLADADKDRTLTRDEILEHSEQFHILLPPDFWSKFMDNEVPNTHDEL